jgi:hypothetical protein
MPVVPALTAPTFTAPGLTVTGLAAPSRGATETRVWRLTLAPGDALVVPLRPTWAQ